MKDLTLTVDPSGGPDCSGVRVWMPREGLEVDFTAKGCIDIRSYSNGAQPGGGNDDDVDYLHVCDLPNFIAALQDAMEAAKPHWRPI